MKFGPVAIGAAEGGILAHSLRTESLTLKKGELLTRAHVETLKAAGFKDVVVAQLEAGDIAEDEAAARVAAAISGPNVRADAAFTGRANLFAECNGVLMAHPALVDALNEVDEQVTLATLPHHRAVVEGEMVGTVKVIPFAVAEKTVARAMAAFPAQGLRIAPYLPKRIAVISTLLPGLKPSTVDKTLRVMAERMAPAHARIVADERVKHEQSVLSAAIARHLDDCDVMIVFGASAITDRRDVIPAALQEAGGTIEQFGMPVDPGNLLLIGQIAGKSFLGAPGCARSPKENGFDWVLQRMLADIPVTAADIRRMGSGGLLMEIVTRPQPRSGEASHGED